MVAMVELVVWAAAALLGRRRGAWTARGPGSSWSIRRGRFGGAASVMDRSSGVAVGEGLRKRRAFHDLRSFANDT
eukprot:scaffold302114_cov21-Tisochrysis_lutea.AAC.3